MPPFSRCFVPARICLLVTFLFALVACSQVPQAELALYREAFARTSEATDEVLDAYNRAEKRNADLRVDVFDPGQAGLIAPDADAPMTALLRRGFEAVESYNTILARYATGDSITVLSDDLAALDHSLARLGTAAGVVSQAAGAGALVQAGTAASRLALARSDSLAFRQSVAANGTQVRGFLLAVREQTPIMHRVFLNSEMAGLSTPADIQSAQANIQVSREMLASWVLLIDETVALLEALEQAVAAGRGRASVVAVLADATDRLARHAEEVRFARRQLRHAF